jgi:benzoyl-CoA reductase/2-hydroxyglutaryl-CoA dehydratase subunit BcrC/BadD/HgdB
MHTELLKLCGFESDEIERETPRVEKLFKILDFGSEDIAKAEKRIAENFDLRLKGVRKMLGVWLRELLTLVLARDEGKKIVHTAVVAPPEKCMAATLTSKDIYCGEPGWILAVVLGGILGKIAPVLEVAERHALTASGDHCSLNKIRLGMYLLGIVPKPDLYTTFSVLCDDGPKVEDLVCELFGIPVSYVQACQDQEPETYPEISYRQWHYLADSFKRDNEKFYEVTGFEIPEEVMNEAVEWRRKLAVPYVKLLKLMENDPQPLSQADMGLLYALLQMPVLERERAISAMETLCGEIEQRVKEGVGVVEKGAPRVIIPGMPSLVDPAFTRMIEQLGLAIPVVEFSFVPKTRRPLPNPTDSTEVWARRFLATNPFQVYTCRVEKIIEACKTLDIDGLLWLNHHSCRPGATDAMILKTAVRERLGLPMIVLDSDTYDHRYYSSTQLKTIIESFAEMLKRSLSFRLTPTRYLDKMR